MKIHRFFVLYTLTILVYSCKSKLQENNDTYLTEKSQFHSKLVRKEKAPQGYEDLTNTTDVIKLNTLQMGITC
jgi:hypothetical protein